MIQYGNRLLPDVGYIFKTNGVISFTVPVGTDCEEIFINTENINIVGNYAFIDSKFATVIEDSRPLKARLINKLFSTDDQIAIILNNEPEILSFMNQWREWFSGVIHKIMDKENE